MKITKSNLSDFSPKTKETIEEILKPTTPNLYLTPGASSILLTKPLSTPPKTYELGRPVKLYTAILPSALLDPRVKLITKSAGILSDVGSKLIEQGYPIAATHLQGMSIIAGGYGCIERLMKPEKYSRLRLIFSLSDFILSVLNFLGKYVPQLKNASVGLLIVKAFVKVGDEVAEYNFSAQEKRELLKDAQSSASLPPSE